WRILCPECEDWCQTSVHIGLPLWAPGQFKSLTNHRGSKKCAATAARKQNLASQGAFHFGLVHLISEGHDVNILLINSTRQNIIHSVNQYTVCPGIPINWPQDLHAFFMDFPWARYHDGPDGLPFTVDITVPRLPRARSKHCTHLTIREDYPCDECGEVYSHIYRLINIARNPKAHTNYRFLGLAHMRDLVKKHADQVNVLKLQV
ncbi:hypothetical protein P692DRAFT_20681422, partial [Suillus brevipes Sb2]